MFDEVDLEMDTNDAFLSPAERQQLYATTNKTERAFLIGYASNYKEKYRNLLLNKLKDLNDNDVDLNLINKYAYERLIDKDRAYEIIYELVDKVKHDADYGWAINGTSAPAAGITRKRKRRQGSKRRRGRKGTFRRRGSKRK